MKTLTRNELASIERLFRLNQIGLLRSLKKFLDTKYDKVICTKDFLIAVGDIPVGLVAHVDTVFTQEPVDIYYDSVKNVLWSPQGLGADDRAGVYAIINIINSGFKPTVIFTTDEEKGCVGASILTAHYPISPVKLKYLIQLDRRGSDDCVFYQCNNEEFEDYVESFGFVTNFGTFSDISVICPEWKMAGVNLSVGYYNEHDVNENLHIGKLYNTIDKVKKMLVDIDNAKYFEYIPDIAYINLMKRYLMEDPSAASDNFWKDCKRNGKHICSCCKEYDFDYNLFPVHNFNDNTLEYYCCDCLSQANDIFWCDECGEPFKSNKLNPEYFDKKVICETCKEHNHEVITNE